MTIHYCQFCSTKASKPITRSVRPTLISIVLTETFHWVHSIWCASHWQQWFMRQSSLQIQMEIIVVMLDDASDKPCLNLVFKLMYQFNFNCCKFSKWLWFASSKDVAEHISITCGCMHLAKAKWPSVLPAKSMSLWCKDASPAAKLSEMAMLDWVWYNKKNRSWIGPNKCHCW